MAGLSDILREEVEAYAGGGRGANILTFPILDDQRQAYTVIAVSFPVRKYKTSIIVMARIHGDQVVIEADNTDKPLVDALMQRGIPREQIILAYADKQIPELTEAL